MLTSRIYANGSNLACRYIVTALTEETLKEAKNTFFLYKEKGVILNENFSDCEWLLTNETKKYKLRFCISEVLYKKNIEKWTNCSYQCFIDGIKSYAVFNLGAFTIYEIQRIVNSLCHISEVSYKAIKPETHTVEFLKLLPDNEIKDQIIEELEERSIFSLQEKRNRRQRVLAEFSSYFYFNDMLEQFWENASYEEKLFYFPIYFWWNLTAILPLRPTEFLLTPRDCLNEINGENILTIRRTRLKSRNSHRYYNVNGDYKLMKYSIPDKLARELRFYINSTNEMTISKLNTLFVQEPHYRYFGKKIPQISCYYSYENLCLCLKRFYSDIVKDEVDRIKLGDTRHLAMIGLIISGGTPVICKELAGHTDINISSHYYSNISRFVECATYEMYRKQKGYYIDIAKHRYTGIGEKIKVKNGYCDSNAYINGSINDCIRNISANGELGECVLCPHFIDEKHGEYLVFLNSEDIKKQVDADSKYLMHVIETVRRGKGCNEDIQSALMKLQHSSARYSQSLYKNLEVL